MMVNHCSLRCSALAATGLLAPLAAAAAAAAARHLLGPARGRCQHEMLLIRICCFHHRYTSEYTSTIYAQYISLRSISGYFVRVAASVADRRASGRLGAWACTGSGMQILQCQAAQPMQYSSYHALPVLPSQI